MKLKLKKTWGVEEGKAHTQLKRNPTYKILVRHIFPALILIGNDCVKDFQIYLYPGYSPTGSTSAFIGFHLGISNWYCTPNPIYAKIKFITFTPNAVSPLLLSVLVGSITGFPNCPDLLPPRQPHTSSFTKASLRGGSQLCARTSIPTGMALA